MILSLFFFINVKVANGREHNIKSMKNDKPYENLYWGVERTRACVKSCFIILFVRSWKQTNESMVSSM